MNEKWAINFIRDLPEVGHAVTLESGQRYEVIRIEDHTRRDGKPTNLITWRTLCAQCGEPFEVTTGRAAKAMNRRCEEHRKPGKRVADGKHGKKRGKKS